MLTAIHNLRQYDAMTEKEVMELKRKFEKDEAMKKKKGVATRLKGKGGGKGRGGKGMMTADEFQQERATKKLQHRWRARRDALAARQPLHEDAAPPRPSARSGARLDTPRHLGSVRR